MANSALELLRQAQPDSDLTEQVEEVHVLLVDDDPNVLKICHRYLADADGLAPDELPVFFHTAVRGEQALEVVKTQREQGNRISAALLDIVLPGAWDGIETCRQLWNHDASIECILMTGAGERVEEVIERRVPGDLLPQCDYLGKPFSRFSVVQRIRRAVHAWCAHRNEEFRRGENIKLVLQLGSMIQEMEVPDVPDVPDASDASDASDD